jgi:hypothetical protein
MIYLAGDMTEVKITFGNFQTAIMKVPDFGRIYLMTLLLNVISPKDGMNLHCKGSL